MIIDDGQSDMESYKSCTIPTHDEHVLKRPKYLEYNSKVEYASFHVRNYWPIF